MAASRVNCGVMASCPGQASRRVCGGTRRGGGDGAAVKSAASVASKRGRGRWRAVCAVASAAVSSHDCVQLCDGRCLRLRGNARPRIEAQPIGGQRTPLCRALARCLAVRLDAPIGATACSRRLLVHRLQPVDALATRWRGDWRRGQDLPQHPRSVGAQRALRRGRVGGCREGGSRW